MGTLRDALAAFGLRIATHRGAAWTYELPNGELAHLCWTEGPGISWTRDGASLLYRDDFTAGGGFDPATANANAVACFRLLQPAMAMNRPVRCIRVAGDGNKNTVDFTALKHLVGQVTLAEPMTGRGIGIRFCKDVSGLKEG